MTGLFDAVEQFVRDNYPVTCREIYGQLPFKDNSIRVALSSMRQEGLRRIHISRWVWEEYGHLIKAIPQYSPGALEDAPKPKKRTQRQHRQRYRLKKHLRVNSVFVLGVPVDDRRTTTRTRADARRTAQREAEPVA